MRRTERFPVEMAVTWTRAGRAIHCLAVDINEHGMFLRTDEIVEHGALMHVVVALPTRALEMFVTARYVGRTGSGQGIGCEIFLIDDVSRHHWVEHYEALAAVHARARKSAAMGA